MSFSERLETDIRRVFDHYQVGSQEMVTEVVTILTSALVALESAHTSVATSLHRRLEIVESRTKDEDTDINSEVSDDV